jgi:hypothetical protein
MGARDISTVPQIQEPFTLQKLNQEIRRIWTQVNGLLGKTGETEVHDNLEVTGAVDVSGGVTAGSLSLGSVTINQTSKDLDPSLTTRKSQALSLTTSVGVPMDLMGPSSPFAWIARDEFLGGDNVTSGSIGDLGWQISGFGGFISSSVPGHPGVLFVVPSGFPTDVMFLNDVYLGDIRYVSAVLTGNVSGVFTFGLMESPAGGLSSLGAFFYSDGVSWQAVTGSPKLQTATTITQFVPSEDWFLLEIVIDAPFAGGGTVDFYINRVGVVRHNDNSVLGEQRVFPTFSTDNAAVMLDRFVMTGEPRMKLWT